MELLRRLRAWLAAEKLDGVLISSRQNKQPHLGISTGSGYVLVSQTAAHILVDFRYYSDIASRAAGYEMHLLNTENPFAQAVNQIIAKEDLTRLGFEGEYVSWQTGVLWRDTLNTTLCSTSLDALRQIKTADEIDRIRAACGIADR
ncbi:TPA: aminopeptidase, partial [Klebsiella pneumoniae]|nr:aminopeptidase [Klebsiella pneumoniae]